MSSTNLNFSNIQNAGGYPNPGYSTPYPSYPPPMMSQPMSSQVSNTTVVVNQGGGAQAGPQIKNWSTGICGCFEDCSSCLFVTFCPWCAACSLLSEVNENPCLFCCVFNWITATRTKVRNQLGIQGSILNDCCMETFCGQCAICQLKREVKLAKQNGHVFF